MEQIFVVNIPEFIFPGFYNTVFSPDDVLTNEDGESYEGDEEEYYTAVEEYQQRVVENIIQHYKEVLPECFKIVSYKLISPNSYNYSNDYIQLEIETTYEDILREFFNFEEENLYDYLELDTDYSCHEQFLETYLEFIPFSGKYDDLYELTLHEKFIYG